MAVKDTTLNVDNEAYGFNVSLKDSFICHLVYEHDFIQLFNDMIVESFDRREHLFVVYAKHAWDSSKKYTIKNSYYINSFEDKVFLELIEKSARIIVHCLYTPELTEFLSNNPHLHKNVNWKLWGGDLYLYRQAGNDLGSKENEAKRRDIINNIGYITSPVEEEYQHAIDVYGGDAQYKFAFYPLPKDFCEYSLQVGPHKEETVSVFVGNSGYPTNNHLQAFSILSKFRNENIKIYCPLSYGDKEYTQRVFEKGDRIFGNKFVPLLDFIPFDEYVNLLNTMDIIVMNHDRQQGVGNILTSLYLGKKVYMQPDITTYKCLSRFGVTVHDINEITNEGFDQFAAFPEAKGKINSEIIKATYSKDSCIKSWQAIFSDAIARKKKVSKRFYMINFHYKDFYSDTIRNPSVGPAFVLQHLLRNGIKTKLHELSFNGDINSLQNDIKTFDPDLIGCSFMTYHYRETYGTIEAIKSLGIPVVCGGAHVNSKGSEVMNEVDVDYLIKGEGEESLLMLLDNINNEEAYSGIPGLVYRKDGVVVENAVEIVDIEELHFPRYKNFCLDKYADGRILIQTSRGCPYQCTFCQQASLLGKKWRARSPQNIMNELEYWGSMGKTSLVFGDDNLTLDKKRIKTLCDLMQKSKYRFQIETAGVRIDNVDYETLKRMRDVGFNYLSFGIESGSDRVLKEIRKGITLKKIHETLEMSCKLDYEIKLYFIINNRTETYKEAQQSFGLSRQYPVRLTRFTNLCPFPGTYDYEWIMKHGRLLYSPEEYLNNPNEYIYVPLYDGPGMSMEERKQIILDAKAELAIPKKSSIKKTEDIPIRAHFPQRVLFINHSIYPLEISGTPLSTRNHVLGMIRRGLEVAVLIPREGIKEGYGKERAADGYTLYQVPAMDKLAAYFTGPDRDGLSEYRQVIEEIIEDFHPQVVHINDYVFMPAEIIEIFSRRGCLVVRGVCNCEELCHRDYPVISSELDGRLCPGPESSRKCADCFSTRPESAEEKTEKRFDYIKRLYRDAVDQVIFTSEPFKEYFTRFVPIPEEKTKVIPRGFDFEFSRNAHARRDYDGTVHFAFVANIMFSKGVDVALHAFEKACHETNFVLHVYGQMGNPEYADWLNRLESRYPGRFIYHGKFEEKDLPEIASRIDVCIIPSYFDTYNRVLREFLYLGTPVIVTDFFGAYIVHDGGNGFKIPVGDADALAGKMLDLINHPDRIEVLARGAAQTRIPTLENEIDRLIGTYEDLYDQVSETKKAALDKMTTPDKTFRSIAFYLPQFHPIPENDQWWGKGFTEWTNVARPLFPEHHQPHLPADLGFYDLRLPDTRKSQADLARKYGVDGFCYWHYWFKGKRLLDQPFRSVLESGEPDFPFCLAWANETWSKRWLGEERNILMKQEYSEEDDRNHALWLTTAFEDKRYIKVNHRPLFLIYRPKDLPNPNQTAEIIRQACLEKGLADPYLVGINSHCTDTDCRMLGFDETLYFMPQLSVLPECMNDDPSESKLRRNGAFGVNSSKLKIYDYEEAMDSMLAGLKGIEHPIIPSLFVGWDNVARRGENGVIVHNTSPEKFGHALQSLVDSVQGKPAQQRFVFLNAWNEWAEGNHLEPDHRNGHAFLEEVRKVKSNGKIQTMDPPAEGNRLEPVARDVHPVRKEVPSEALSVSSRVESDTSKIRAIAFYLPQYHPIPENDRWWGKGFTEWTNVAKANPLFPGHYQPHMPADLGFYDLRLPEIRNAQAELAREHGIHGFCYYHYWFNGKILLDSPLRKVLESGEPDFPFCVCWANENWTRAWDGRNSDILIRQNYSPEDDLNHIRHLSGIFSDPRYIKIDGKPLFIVYRASNMPDPLRTTSLWREEARKSGLGELFLCRVERFVEDMKDPRSLGFDAAVEFQPDGIHLGKPDPDPRYAGNAVYKYKELVKAALSKKDPAYLRFPCACPGWDNSPRRQENAVVFRQSYPQFYESWLEELIARAARRRPEERIVFINAFNEWGEGCHLEPDKRFGKAYLEATRRALGSCISAGSGAAPRVSIVIPVFNRLEYTRQCLEALVDNTPSDLYEVILVNNGSTDGTEEFLSNLKGDVTVITNETDLGFGKACNQGLEKAKGEYVLLLNNDVVATEGWLEKLLTHIEPSQDAGMVGPMSNAALGPQWVRKVPYGSDMEEMQAYALDFAAGSSGETDVTMGLGGFCLLIRKELLDIVGGLDERYIDGNFKVDDLCLRSFIAGYRNVLAGDVFVHNYGGMASQGKGMDSRAALKGDLRYFCDKWKGLVEADGVGYRVCLTRERQLKALLDWGEERFSQGNFRAAMKTFERVLCLDGSNSQALNNLGVIQWQIGDAVSAMKTFQIALGCNPKDPDALDNLAKAAAGTGRFDLLKPEILKLLKRARPADPDVEKLIVGGSCRS
jgi:lipopolysaccharide biosynthesis protein/radical SAM superfamily enzyme YgiQ (UPF0313 family)/GT2 family glycosyltransferase